MNYKYRLYPNKQQENMLRQFCGAQRFIWNHYLNEEMETYKEHKKFRFSHKNITSLPKLKSELEWLKLVPSTSLQQTLLYQDRALKQSFKGNTSRKGFPKFKSKRNFNGSFSLVVIDNKSIIDNKYFKCPKIGKIKIVMERELPSNFRSCKIKQHAGKWFVVFTVKKKKLQKSRALNRVLGIDFNSKEIVVSSSNKQVTNPKYLAKAKLDLARKQRILSKKIKGSNNRRKQQLIVAKAYDKISSQRKDFLDKLSYELVQSNDLICLEDLNIAGMSKFNGNMVADAGWSMLRSMIEYKAELYGKHVQIVGRYFPSTQLCSLCGTIQKKSLNERTHVCDCGLNISRDLNAAINIKNEGLDIFIKNRVGTTRINACGDSLSLR